jgi:hypothetical protein
MKEQAVPFSLHEKRMDEFKKGTSPRKMENLFHYVEYNLKFIEEQYGLRIKMTTVSTLDNVSTIEKERDYLIQHIKRSIEFIDSKLINILPSDEKKISQNDMILLDKIERRINHYKYLIGRIKEIVIKTIEDIKRSNKRSDKRSNKQSDKRSNKRSDKRSDKDEDDDGDEEDEE